MTLALAVGVAGAVGAVARYLADGAVQDRTAGPFPFGTLTVNVVGSLILGFLAGYTLSHTGGGTAKTVDAVTMLGRVLSDLEKSGLTSAVISLERGTAELQGAELVESDASRSVSLYSGMSRCSGSAIVTSYEPRARSCPPKLRIASPPIFSSMRSRA